MGFFDKFVMGKRHLVSDIEQDFEAKEDSDNLDDSGFEEELGREVDMYTEEGSGDVQLISIPYTIEPGYLACNRFLPRRSMGGIGVINQLDKFHDYEDADYPGLSDFLDALTYVDGEYPSYFTLSKDEMNHYFVRYMRNFASDEMDYTFLALITSAMVDHYNAYDEIGGDQYFPNIVIGSDYYNFIFYKIATLVAFDIFPYDLLQTCFRDFGPSKLTKEKRFINEFDHFKRCTFVFDCPEGNFHAVSRANDIGERKYGPIYHCSENDYKKFFKPYIHFLSNFSLILGANLATNIFGQCAFTLGWEKGQSSIDLPRDKWPHPKSN